MKYIIDKQIVLSRAPEGPLGTYIGPFARSLREQGYARYSIHRQVRLAACFSEWLRPKFDSLRQFSGIALSGSPAKSAEKALFRLSALKIIVQNIFLPIADSRIFCA